jgi:hypothetical protein
MRPTSRRRIEAVNRMGEVEAEIGVRIFEE